MRTRIAYRKDLASCGRRLIVKRIRLRLSGRVVCPDFIFMEEVSPCIVITLIRVGVIGKEGYWGEELSGGRMQ